MIRSGVVGKTGRVRLRGDALAALRRQCFVRDGWACTVCLCPISWASGHMAHIKSRGAGGSDVLTNLVTKCGDCHRAEHNPRAIPHVGRS